MRVLRCYSLWPVAFCCLLYSAALVTITVGATQLVVSHTLPEELCNRHAISEAGVTSFTCGTIMAIITCMCGVIVKTAVQDDDIRPTAVTGTRLEPLLSVQTSL